LTVVDTVSTTTAVAKAIMNVSSIKFDFYDGYYEEKVKLPLIGLRTTRWLVCCYFTPTCRLVRCVDGFVGKDETKAPFAIATLRNFTLSAQGGGGGPQEGGGLEYNEHGLSFWPKAGVTEPGCMCVIGGSPKLCFELQSPWRGCVRVDLDESPFKYLQQLGPGFWNLRTPFKVWPHKR